jgi:hypothetical protein
MDQQEVIRDRSHSQHGWKGFQSIQCAVQSSPPLGDCCCCCCWPGLIDILHCRGVILERLLLLLQVS